MKTDRFWSGRHACALAAGAIALITSVPCVWAAEYPAYPDDPAPTRDDRGREDADDRGPEGGRRARARISGTVTRVINEEMFDIAMEDDRRVRILSRGLGGFQPKVGDRISAYGQQDGDFFVARRIRLAEETAGEPIDGQPRDDAGRELDERDFMQGTVTQVLGADSFRVRNVAGRVFRVRALNDDLRNLRVNDRIKIHGAFDANDVFVADHVLPADEVGPQEDTRTTLYGAVIALRGNDSFEMRAEDNRIYRVRGLDSLPAQLRIGSPVAVRGDVDRDQTLVADRVDVTASRDPDRRQLKRGTVRAVFSDASFDLVAEDGIQYRVKGQYRRARAVIAGDRVEVDGTVHRDRTISAETVTFLASVRRGVDFPAAITSLTTRQRLVVRGDNGRDYTVRTRAPIADNLRAGDRVRVTGNVDNGIVVDAEIAPLETVAEREQKVDFPATVLRIERLPDYDEIRVRGDNNREYLLRYTGDTLLRVNDKVRVKGSFVGDYVDAESITLR